MYEFVRRRIAFGLAVLVLVVLPLGAQTAAAQPAGVDSLAEGRGTARLVGWPDVSLDQLLDEMGRRAPRLLPRIDSMALDYGYVAGDSTSDWSFEITWRPGDAVLEEGAVKPWSEAPSDVRMASVELLADVVVEGEQVAQMIVAVDSMALRPYPSAYTFDVTVGHDRVFLNTTPSKARQYLEAGVRLDGLVVERMGFVSSGPATGEAREGDRPRTDDPRAEPRREPVPPPSIYEPRTTILIGWRVGPDPYYVAPRPEAEPRERPRGESTGTPTDRTATGDVDARPTRGESVDREDATRRDAPRSGDAPEERTTADRRDGRDADREGDRGDARRGSDRGSDGDSEGDSGRASGKSGGTSSDDDDDDDPSLAAPALGAVAAVGLLAYAGGTVGVSGTGETPLGLTAGYTHERGGVQLQASVNSAVIDQADGQLLSVKALGFYDVFESRVQPAFGLGVQADAAGGTTVEPAVSAGLVGNLGRFVLYGGFDVVQGTPELSLAYNFRYKSKEDGDDAIAGR